METYAEAMKAARMEFREAADKFLKVTEFVGQKVMTPEDLVRVFEPNLAGKEQEEMMIVLLDSRMNVIHTEILFRGTLNSIQVRIAEIVRPAVMHNAAAMAFAHNHPTGDPEPSANDIVVSQRVEKACKILEITLADSIVIGHPGKWVSLKSRGNIGWKS